jgi:hypothetical protein
VLDVIIVSKYKNRVISAELPAVLALLLEEATASAQCRRFLAHGDTYGMLRIFSSISTVRYDMYPWHYYYVISSDIVLL